MSKNVVATFLHEPLWRTGGTTYPNGLHTLKPVEIYLIHILYLITIGIYTLTLHVQHSSIGALASTHKQN